MERIAVWGEFFSCPGEGDPAEVEVATWMLQSQSQLKGHCDRLKKRSNSCETLPTLYRCIASKLVDPIEQLWKKHGVNNHESY